MGGARKGESLENGTQRAIKKVVNDGSKLVEEATVIMAEAATVAEGNVER